MPKRSMSRACPSQMKKLLDLLSEDGVIINGRVVYNNTNYKNFWKRIALQLNAVEGGVYKSTWKWCKTWADWKNKTKKKANILLSRKNYMLQTSSPLSDLELRLLKIIDYPMDGKCNELEMVQDNKIDELDTTAIELQFLDKDYSDLQNKETLFKDEDNYNDICETEFCDITDTFNDDHENKKYSSSIDKEKVTIKGKAYKKRKLSLEEYKIKSTLEIEKERVQQKSEELRLRALELKLKGEELRLKEIEMNKINYLTNIEEEKLKCFREISSSLKELLEKNGITSLRFNSS